MLIIKKKLLLFTNLILPLISRADDDPKKVADFTLKDFNGKSYTLSDYKDAKVVVLMFISTRCPVSNSYNERMVQLYDDYSAKGVTFLAINANKLENVDEIKEHAQEHKFPFPVLKDVKNSVADAVDAQVTPEIFVVNKDLQLLYHGRIDDSQRESNVKTKDLRIALDAILTGKPVPVFETKAFGCSIKRVD
jgi:peroxiredoxin